MCRWCDTNVMECRECGEAGCLEHIAECESCEGVFCPDCQKEHDCEVTRVDLARIRAIVASTKQAG